MIIINKQLVKPEDLIAEKTNNDEKKIIEQMNRFNIAYTYEAINHLTYELKFRTNTMKAARELNKSGVKFTTYTYSTCNRKYWTRLSNGGFLLKSTAAPSTAFLDILQNGSLYAFECATAIAIILYIAALYSVGKTTFDMYFNDVYLMDWQFDEDLLVISKEGYDFLPGDVLHFKNPEFDPKQPHWQAENVIYFGDDEFYGHGIGIRNASTIVKFLNSKRKKNAKESAFLMRLITRPHYYSLFLLAKGYG